MTIRGVKKFVAFILAVSLAVIISDMSSAVVVGMIEDTIPAQGRFLALTVILLLLIAALRFIVERKDR